MDRNECSEALERLSLNRWQFIQSAAVLLGVAALPKPVSAKPDVSLERAVLNRVYVAKNGGFHFLPHPGLAPLLTAFATGEGTWEKGWG